MRGLRKSGVILCSIFCLMLVLVTGCSKIEVPDNLSVPALAVTSKGQVTAWIVERFDKDYYDLEELRNMVSDEIKQFNEGHRQENGSDAVTVQSLEKTAAGDEVKLVLNFRDSKAYKDYTGSDLFYGTVAQAQKAGYDLEQQLISTKDASTIDQTDMKELDTKRILIIQEKVTIYGPGRPLYISPGVTVNQDGSVSVTEETEDNIYIIMK